MKIYTKIGDRGTTSLFGGKRVGKNSSRIEAYGNVDELNSLIGIVIAELNYSSSEREQVEKLNVNSSRPEQSRRTRTINDLISTSKKLTRIQNELFVLGTDLATPLDVKTKVPRISKVFTTRLEKEIDAWQKELPELKKFILPGGGRVGAKLHLARTVARRAERSIATLSSEDKVNAKAVVYINRLSDWLFVLARYVNKVEKIKEVTWIGRG